MRGNKPGEQRAICYADIGNGRIGKVSRCRRPGRGELNATREEWD